MCNGIVIATKTCMINDVYQCHKPRCCHQFPAVNQNANRKRHKLTTLKNNMKMKKYYQNKKQQKSYKIRVTKLPLLLISFSYTLCYFLYLQLSVVMSIFRLLLFCAIYFILKYSIFRRMLPFSTHIPLLAQTHNISSFIDVWHISKWPVRAAEHGPANLTYFFSKSKNKSFTVDFPLAHILYPSPLDLCLFCANKKLYHCSFFVVPLCENDKCFKLCHAYSLFQHLHVCIHICMYVRVCVYTYMPFVSCSWQHFVLD